MEAVLKDTLSRDTDIVEIAGHTTRRKNNNNNNNDKEIIVSGAGLECETNWPACNPKLRYSHAITHDATTLKEPGSRPAAPVPQEYLISS